MNALWTIFRLLRRLPPEVVDGVADIVHALVHGDDAKVRRQTEEALRRRAFDEAMKKVKG